jgi:hypothetical protein
MGNNPEDYKDFIPYSEAEGIDKAWERYLRKMKNKGWGGPHELRALEATLGIKFEIWFANFDEQEEVTDIQVQRHHPVDLREDTIILLYVANTQHDEGEDIGDHYMVLVQDGTGRHLSRVSRFAAMTLEEKGTITDGAELRSDGIAHPDTNRITNQGEPTIVMGAGGDSRSRMSGEAAITPKKKNIVDEGMLTDAHTDSIKGAGKPR